MRLALAVIFAVASAPQLLAQTPAFERLAHLFRPVAVDRKEGLPRWSWPSSETFASRLARYEVDARPWTVADVRFRLTSGRHDHTWAGQAHIAARSMDGWWQVELIAAKLESGESHANLPVLTAPKWRLIRGDWSASSTPHFEAADGSTLSLSTVVVEKATPLTMDLWAAWVLSTTLLQSDHPEEDRAIERGRCSMDRRPMDQAVSFARDAYRKGETGRFLRFRLRVMGDRFQRPIASSYGQASLATRASGLKTAPIDVDRFLIGLVLSVTAERPSSASIGAFRLGRSIADAGLSETMLPRLRRLVSDPHLDSWNRTRALIVLMYALAHDPTKEPLSRHTSMSRRLQDVITGLEQIPMPAATRAFLDHVRSSTDD